MGAHHAACVDENGNPNEAVLADGGKHEPTDQFHVREPTGEQANILEAVAAVNSGRRDNAPEC